MKVFSPKVSYYPNYIFFYPNGNTPANSLLSSVPQHFERVHFLLLGCGDLRNMLFTTWHLNSESIQGSKRKLDFTLCDYEAAVHARNIILLVLATDAKFAEDRSKSNYMWQLWCIYYYQFINNDCYDLIQRCVSHILSFCDNWDSWHQGHIGKYIQITSENAFIYIRKIWCAYRNTKLNTKDVKKRRNALYKNHSFEGFNCTSFRNIGLIPQSEDLQAHDALWKKYFQDGFYSDYNEAEFSKANPLFAITQCNGVKFATHYGANPILGYSLVSATMKALNKPFAVNCELDLAQRLVKVCQMQFEEWLLATRNAIENSQLVIHIYCGDALECCLQLSEPDGGNRSLLQWKLPSVKNSISHNTPRLFDVIDTSNLSDHLGLLNMLVCAEPLLKDHPSAILYTDKLTHTKVEQNRKKVAERELCMSLESAAVILGLSLVDEGLPIRFNSKNIKEEFLSSTPRPQLYIQMPWRRTVHFDPSFSNIENPEFSLAPLDTRQFIEFFTEVFAKMYKHKNIETAFTYLTTGNVGTVDDLINFHHNTCQGFARLLGKYLSRLNRDYSQLLEELYASLALLTSTIVIVTNLQQDFFIWLHILGIYTCEFLKGDPKLTFEKFFYPPRNLPELIPLPKPYPSVSLLCLAIPRENIIEFLGIPGCLLLDEVFQNKLVTPPLVCQIEASVMSNFFCSIHLSFGSVQKLGENYGDKAYLRCSHFNIVEADSLHDDSATLIVLVYVPTFDLLTDPNECHISLFVDNNRCCIKSPMIYKKLGPEMKIYTTTFADTEHVSVVLDPLLTSKVKKCKQSIMKKDSEVVLANQCYFESNGITSAQWTMNNENTSNLKTVLQSCKVEISQNSIFSLDLILSSSDSTESIALKRKVMMPFMVDVNKSTVKFSRKNCYIIITAKPGYPTAPISPEAIFPRFFRSLNSDDSILPFSNVIPSINVNTCVAIDIIRNRDWLKHIFNLGSLINDSAIQGTKHFKDESSVLNVRQSILCMLSEFTNENIDPQNLPFFTLGDDMAVYVDGIHYETVLDTIVLNMCVSAMPKISVVKIFNCIAKNRFGVIKIKCTTEELSLWHLFLTVMLENNSGILHKSTCKYRKHRESLVKDEQLQLYCQCALGKNLPASFCRKYSEICEHFYSVSIPLFFKNVQNLMKIMEETTKILTSQQISVKHCCIQCKKDEQATEKKKLLVCGKCKSVKYCSKECQLKHWKIHKTVCCAQK